MVIAKPDWFGRRKYTGWGVTPKTWQGWIYLAAVLLPFIIFQSLPYWSQETKVTVTIVWIIFLFIDIGDVMIRMKKDERERTHEAIAERNALWIVMIVLVVGIFYQILTSALQQEIRVDLWIVVALFAGIVVKAISNIYLSKKN